MRALIGKIGPSQRDDVLLAGLVELRGELGVRPSNSSKPQKITGKRKGVQETWAETRLQRRLF